MPALISSGFKCDPTVNRTRNASGVFVSAINSCVYEARSQSFPGFYRQDSTMSLCAFTRFSPRIRTSNCSHSLLATASLPWASLTTASTSGQDREWRTTGTLKTGEKGKRRRGNGTAPGNQGVVMVRGGKRGGRREFRPSRGTSW